MSNTKPMTLTGLQPNNPLAVMAAYGVLRLLPDATLRWPGVYPELQCGDDPITRLAAVLPKRQRAPENTLFNKPEDISDLRVAAAQIPTDWLLAFVGESSTGLVRSNLKLLAGGHRFITNARDIMAELEQQDAEVRLREALFGPWQYARGSQAWGWDARANVRTAALSRESSDAPKYSGLGAAWLAWESLPLWPVVNGHTLGWSGTMRYVTVGEWVGWHDLRGLMLGFDDFPKREQKALGIREWHALRLGTWQYGAVLGWAQQVL
jgi:hypothetical protein